MQNWESKLKIFLDAWEYMDDTIGILVCGSYITGNPNEHSDLDVHIILDEKVDFRERGNRYVDGLLIEYFANTPNQIRQYFTEDYQAISQMSQTQFATGSIWLDKFGEVQKLKEEAIKMIEKKFEDVKPKISELHKYALWDAMDDLQALYKANRHDFDFIYFVNLDMLIGTYMKLSKLSYDKKTMLGHLESCHLRKKYLLTEISDKKVVNLIRDCITQSSKTKRLKAYEELTHIVFDLSGGFDINAFKFKSPKDLNREED